MSVQACIIAAIRDTLVGRMEFVCIQQDTARFRAGP